MLLLSSKLPSHNVAPDLMDEIVIHLAKAEYARHLRRHTQMQLDRAVRIREERHARLHGGYQYVPRRHQQAGWRKVDARGGLIEALRNKQQQEVGTETL